jgi:pyruvate dehydrogenase E1 component
MPLPYAVLGTDGFGRSDTRENLRRFFEVDTEHLVYTTLASLAQTGRITRKVLIAARDELGIDATLPNPARVDAVIPTAASASKKKGGKKRKGASR